MEARVAAGKIIKLIEDKSNNRKEEGTYKSQNLIGKIEFKNVEFFYPSRKKRKVIDNFSYVFEPGKTTAICGETGSGKSTII